MADLQRRFWDLLAENRELVESKEWKQPLTKLNEEREALLAGVLGDAPETFPATLSHVVAGGTQVLRFGKHHLRARDGFKLTDDGGTLAHALDFDGSGYPLHHPTAPTLPASSLPPAAASPRPLFPTATTPGARTSTSRSRAAWAAPLTNRG